MGPAGRGVVPPDFARGVDLDEAIFDRGTRWPEHFDPVQRGAELVPAP